MQVLDALDALFVEVVGVGRGVEVEVACGSVNVLHLGRLRRGVEERRIWQTICGMCKNRSRSSIETDQAETRPFFEEAVNRSTVRRRVHTTRHAAYSPPPVPTPTPSVPVIQSLKWG